jgi:hypothetical protein
LGTAAKYKFTAATVLDIPKIGQKLDRKLRGLLLAFACG